MNEDTCMNMSMMGMKKRDEDPFAETRYGTHAKQPLYQPLAIALRCLFAFVMALILAPITAPAFVQLPSCLFVRVLERVAARVLRFISNIAAVEAVIKPRSDPTAPDAPALEWLPLPLIRSWTSPLPKGRFVRTFDQPGRWMSDEQLSELSSTLEMIAKNSIGTVPTHRLFAKSLARQVLSNRIISIAHDKQGALGFTAMVYLEYPDDMVMHLGLTMITNRGRGKRLQSALFTKSLLLPIVNLCRMGYFVTNVAASPAGIGNVSEYFFDCYPTYTMANPKKEHHVLIARHILNHYRYEFGCSELAVFDERTFVVYKSNDPQGGGTHQFIKQDGAPISQHKDEECNRFVARLIDFSAGDELFQVAKVNVLGSLFKYITRTKKSRPGTVTK